MAMHYHLVNIEFNHFARLLSCAKYNSKPIVIHCISRNMQTYTHTHIHQRIHADKYKFFGDFLMSNGVIFTILHISMKINRIVYKRFSLSASLIRGNHAPPPKLIEKTT